MKDAGLAHMGVGRAAGENKAEEAARMAISSPLLETSIAGAHGVLVNISGDMNIGLEEVEIAASLVQQAANPDANIIFGSVFDETLEDEIRVTVIATGFDEEGKKGGADSSATFRPVKEEKKAPAPAAQPEEPAPEPEPEPESEPEPAPEPELTPEQRKQKADDDYFNEIFNIFNKKKKK
jgi:cell division protein FtsZ